MNPIIAFVFLLLFVVDPITALGDSLGDDWPQFRGNEASGVASGEAPPISWDIPESKNIAWKTQIPGLGFASPVILGDQVFIVTAVGEKEDPSLRLGLYGDIKSVDDEGPHSWEVYSISLRTGRVLWKRVLYVGIPKMKRHTKSSHANATPATDGKHLIVHLASEGLYCLDVRGNLCWKKDLGDFDSGYFRAPDAQWGYASSPIIFNGVVYILADIQKDSYLTALDVRNGRELWRTGRNDVPTWGTPAIAKTATAHELIVNGFKQTAGYDPQTGQELWTLDGGGDIPVPTPIVGNDLVYLSSAHGRDRPLRAIRPGGRGDISLQEDSDTSDNIAWTQPKDGIYLQTPLLYGPHLYACRNNGIISCYNAKTGERLYRERLGGGGGFTASPVAAAGRLYFTSEEGEVYVVRPGEKYELLAKNEMNDVCLATPAIAKGILVMRTKGHLYGLTQKPDSDRFFSVDTLKRPASKLTQDD
ncbi:MAG: PQQ-binding-like beta-propeller repeat protein [Planctomycetota bacterium]